MIQIYFEQLHNQLNKELRNIYFLFGNDLFLLQESYDMIKRSSMDRGYREHYTFQIDKNTNWKEIISICRTTSFFSFRRSIQFLLSDESFYTIANKQLKKIVKLSNNNLLLIFRGKKSVITQKIITLLSSISSFSVQVICLTPDRISFPKWITLYAKKKNMNFDKKLCEILCYYYEGNLLFLSQIIEIFSLMYPNEKLTLSRVENIIDDFSYFTPFHWIDSILSAEGKRAIRILQKLYTEETEPLILLRILQKEILLLIKIKFLSKDTSFQKLFNKCVVWKNHQKKITKAIDRLDKKQLQKSVKIMTEIELMIKQKKCNNKKLIWNKLEILSLLLCYNEFKNTFNYY